MREKANMQGKPKPVRAHEREVGKGDKKMIILNRKMKVEETLTVNGELRQSRSQASINSDGRITLRNYDPYAKDNDEIIILSENETKAIFDLMRVMKGLGVKNEDMPF